MALWVALRRRMALTFCSRYLSGGGGRASESTGALMVEVRRLFLEEAVACDAGALMVDCVPGTLIGRLGPVGV